MRTGDEFREIFNLKYNNINSGISPGINDYEISLYLTEAQRQIVAEYYTGKITNPSLSFETIERIREDISKIVEHRIFEIAPSVNPPTKKYNCYTVVIPNGV